MAQIMNYWEHPVRGVGSYSYLHPEYGTLFADFGATTYDWDNMKNIYSRGYNDAEALAVATLVYHCGVAVNMDYGPHLSVAPPKLDSAMRNFFDYSPSTNYMYKSGISDAQWINSLKSDLNSLQPVLYKAASNNNNDNAHIFVCDGYDENDFFHFNWGHGGNYDGYYTISGLHEGSVNYTYRNAAMFGCYPNTPSITPPANISLSVSERDVSVSWTMVSGAACYKLYRDGDLIANNLMVNSYVDVNVNFGNHSYYIKSVRSDGTMSLKSNSVYANVHFPGPKPSDLQANINGHNVNLIWQTQNPETALLQYGTGDYLNHTGYDNGTYWAQRFPTSVLCEYAGMAIEKVSAYFLYQGNYTLFFFKGDEINTNEMLYQQSFTATAENWKDIFLTSPLTIDYTQDLWVVLYSSINKPAPVCVYTMPDKQNAALFSNTGVRWTPIANRSCMMKTYITDGTYTYNLYRDGEAMANNLTGNSYTDINLSDGFYDYHVTTNYFGGESDPSNTVHVQVGNPTFTIAALANPTNGGTVSGAGIYNYGETCTLTASPTSGYQFESWKKNGLVVSTNSNYSFNVTENATYTAYFSETPVTYYTITTNVTPSGAGTVNGGGTFPSGTIVTLTATANPGYTFNRWDDGSTQNPRVVTVNSNLNFTAYFTQNQYIITVVANPSNAGTVSGGGAYYYGDYATLTATAYSGYEFQGWSDGSNENPHQVTVTGNATYTATFSQAGTTYYTVSAYVSPNGAGSVSGTGTFPAGNSTTLTATANSGYTFSHWNDGITTNPRTVTVNNNMSFTAYFTTQQYTITVNANPPLGGTVTGGGTYPYGATTRLTAMPNSGYSFMQWSDGNTANPRTITVTGNASYTALFISAGGETFMLTVTSGNLLLGQVAGGGVYPAGAMVEIRAIPASYSRFVKWNDGNTDNPRTVVVNHNLEFVAEFVAIPQYTITVNSSNNEWGYVMGGGTFTDGTEIQISAFANTGYMFAGWNDGNNQNPRTITVTGNATYTARFVENTMTTYTLNLTCNANEGTVSGGGVYTAGTVVTIQAFPNPGYVFTKWSDEVGDNPRMLMVNSDMTLEAFFATGIDDNTMGNVKVYPNPANESICLIGIETNSEIQIYNMLGELVRTVNAGPYERIGISGLANGVYIVRVGRISTRICIIN